jgi:hypothetical protein
MARKINLASPGVAVSFTWEPEEFPPDGEFEDNENITWIKKEMQKGNEWAWCRVKVTVNYKNILTSDHYLGACSYKSAAGLQEGRLLVYYDDMVQEGINKINKQLEKL